MDQNKREVANALGDVILTAYTQTKNQEERMEIPLMIEVPVSWVSLIKELTPKDPFTTVELALRGFFDLGASTFLETMQQKYTSPHDLICRYIELQSK